MKKVRYIPNNRRTKALVFPLVLQIMTIKLYPAYKYFADCTGNDEWNCRFYNIIGDLAFSFWVIYKHTEWETTSRDYMLHFVEERLYDIMQEYDMSEENAEKVRCYLRSCEEYCL